MLTAIRRVDPEGLHRVAIAETLRALAALPACTPTERALVFDLKAVADALDGTRRPLSDLI